MKAAIDRRGPWLPPSGTLPTRAKFQESRGNTSSPLLCIEYEVPAPAATVLDTMSHMVRPLFPLPLAIMFAAASFAQKPCEQLRSLALPDTTITAAELVPAGAEPAHCQVLAVLAPT